MFVWLCAGDLLHFHSVIKTTAAAGKLWCCRRHGLAITVCGQQADTYSMLYITTIYVHVLNKHLEAYGRRAAAAAAAGRVDLQHLQHTNRPSTPTTL
jgi:hypothetical protein